MQPASCGQAVISRAGVRYGGAVLPMRARVADVSQRGRLTWIGDAEPVNPNDTEISRRYLRYFPSSESYFQAHDFSLYCIHLRRARFIGGFGQIFWVEAGEMLLANPFRQAETGIVKHMNEDHQKALRHYCQVLKGVDVQAVAMTGIDAEGFDLLADGQKLRMDFDSPISTVEEARATLAKLARA